MKTNAEIHKEHDDIINKMLDSNEKIFDAMTDRINYLENRIVFLESKNASNELQVKGRNMLRVS